MARRARVDEDSSLVMLVASVKEPAAAARAKLAARRAAGAALGRKRPKGDRAVNLLCDAAEEWSRGNVSLLRRLFTGVADWYLHRHPERFVTARSFLHEADAIDEIRARVETLRDLIGLLRGREQNVPTVPDDLVEVCAAGNAIAYVGAGLSAPVGYPTWVAFVRWLVDVAAREAGLSRGAARAYRAAVREGDADAVADNVVSLFGEAGPDRLNLRLRQRFLAPGKPTPVHDVLRQLGLSAVLTTNFDRLLEQTFGSESPVFTPAEIEPLLEALGRRKFFILKLYGKLESGVLVAPSQYDEQIRGNVEFGRFMETVFHSRTLLFLGASLEGIEGYLRGIELRPSGRHYALVAVSGTGWEAKANQLQRRYGIVVLPYRPSQKAHPEVFAFVGALRARVDQRRHASRLPAASKAVAETKPGTRLTRVVLRDIGAFAKLDLELDPRWNILLGDNGVGKSTVLRAIATAVAGRDAAPYAQRLLRAPAGEGLIELHTDGVTYQTVIRRTRRGVEIESRPIRPLEAEGWLVLGFPPLRAVSWQRPQGPHVDTPRSFSVDDVLPLLESAVDPRVDQLKQWIVNLDYAIKDELARSEHGDRPKRLLDELFQLITDLTPGLRIEYGGVDVDTNEVTVRTSDGEVPIEAVSQGTTAMIGWGGVALRRLHEVYASETHPRAGSMIVLLDELDAHLHPAWQRGLVERITKVFPGAQFIATTHSPLIVGGMEPKQVVRVVRAEDGVVSAFGADASMVFGRADQILTGELFGLETTLDPKTERCAQDYADQLGKSARTPEEEAKLRALETAVERRIPPSLETPPERRAQELLELLLRQQAGALLPEAQRSVLEAAERLLAAVAPKRVVA